MPTYRNTERTARMQVIADALNGGTLEILDGSSTVLSTHDLAATSGTVSNGVLTFGAIADGTASAGTAASARLKNTGGDVIASGLTVGASGSGADLIVSSTTFNAGQNVQVSSLSITEGND